MSSSLPYSAACLILCLGARGLAPSPAIAADRTPDAVSDPAAAPAPGAARGGAGDSPAALQASIDRAIEKGRDALLPRLDGMLRSLPEEHPVGRIALVAAALLKSGVAAGDPRIASAFARLETLKVEKTYCAACYLFALDALWRTEQKEAKEGKQGLRPAGETRKRIGELVGWLVEARVKGHGSWTYEPAGKPPRKADRHDFSNTQFAVLGLRIGLEHGVDVPAEAFAETARLFTDAMTREPRTVDLEYTVDAPLEVKLHLTRASPLRRCRLQPGGWGYTDPRRGKSKLDEPYASMTAAGASSLAIALGALAGGRGAPRERTKLLADGERALQSAYAWIAARFDLFLADDRQLFYTLYSLEKAGDLGGVEKFGSHDWYLEGAARIVEKQRANGSWGTYVDTSLALLFLTRAARMPRAVAAPVILTGGRKDRPPEGAADLVYIERAGGFLSAAALLEYLGETRSTALVPIAEEALRNYAPDSREDLVPRLLVIWRKEDPITGFARRALEEITGTKSAERRAYVEWQEGLEAVKALESREGVEAADLALALKKAPGPRLKARLAGLAQRRELRGLAGLLVEELSVPSLEYRRKVHGILSLWTDSAVAAPPKDTEAAWEATAKAWQEWWRVHGGAWRN